MPINMPFADYLPDRFKKCQGNFCMEDDASCHSAKNKELAKLL